MSEDTKKIVLPAYLLRRFEAFRIARGSEHTYLLRDKVQGKTYDFDPWQFFILEILPASDSFERLKTSFEDRFDRKLTRKELDTFLGSVADRKLFDDSAGQHPLLQPYMQRSYDVEAGKAVARPFSAPVVADPDAPSPVGAPPMQPPPLAAPPAPKPAAAPAAAAEALDPASDLPAGVQDAFGLDWRTTKVMWGLFDPRPVLNLLLPVVRPLRWLMYAVPVLLLAALLLLVNYFDPFSDDLAALHLDINLAQHLLFLFLTVQVVVSCTAAFVAHAYKVQVETVGFALAFGFMPRWALKMNGADRLTRRQTMWLHGSTLIARVLMFAVGVLVWYNTRDTDNGLSQYGMLLAFGCGAGLLLEAGNPLVKANGYFLLSAYLNEPHLRGKAYAALLNKMKGGVYRAADSSLLVLYALLSTTYVVLIILVVGWMIAKFILGELELGGSAIIIVCAFVGYLLWRNYAGLKKFGETFARQVQFDRWRSRTLPVDAVEGEVARKQPSYWKRALLLALVLALFLPYPYEPGGPFLTYPTRRQTVSTDEPGLVEAVFFDGGESVPRGTTIAQLAHVDYQSQIKVLSAKIDEQAAVVNNLKTLPKPQEVKLAEQMLEVERAKESFSREKWPRLEKLYKVGAVSFEEFDTARKDHLTDVQQVAQKEAELALVKAPVTAAQLEAAQAKLVSLREERGSYETKVKRTVLTMPFDGNILTLHLKDKINSYLEKGAPFAALEDTSVVTLEIEVPESDVQFVKVGSTIRARPVAYFDDREFEGKVTVIDRNITPKSTGNVVKVIAAIDNRDGLLKTGMAGRAKVVGTKMPVWRAFSLAIVRFVQIQVWSWIP